VAAPVSEMTSHPASDHPEFTFQADYSHLVPFRSLLHATEPGFSSFSDKDAVIG